MISEWKIPIDIAFLEDDKYKVHILNDFPINEQHQTIFILIYFDLINESLIIKQDSFTMSVY